MKTPRISVVIFVLLLLGGAAFTQTPIIKLNVPVRLTTLNENVTAVRVYCFSNRPNAGGTDSDGAVEIPCPADGNVNQTVTVQLKQTSIGDITKDVEVVARIDLKVNGEWKRPSQSTVTPIEWKAKPGTEYNDASKAPIPW
jgi:hypothetical protein